MKSLSTILTTLLLSLAVVATPATAKPLSKADLLSMAESGVADDHILLLVERDCVDFEVTADILVELTPKMSKPVLDAVLKCNAKAVLPMSHFEATVSGQPASVVAVSHPTAATTRGRWDGYWAMDGHVGMLQLGASSREIRSQFESQGFSKSFLQGDSGAGGLSICRIDTNDKRWKAIRPDYGITSEQVGLQRFQNRILVLAHLIEVTDQSTAQRYYVELREFFSKERYGTPPSKLFSGSAVSWLPLWRETWRHVLPDTSNSATPMDALPPTSRTPGPPRFSPNIGGSVPRSGPPAPVAWDLVETTLEWAVADNAKRQEDLLKPPKFGVSWTSEQFETHLFVALPVTGPSQVVVAFVKRKATGN